MKVSHHLSCSFLYDTNPFTDEKRTVDIPIHAIAEPEGPFVLADPVKLNMPVFAKPIVAPLVLLTNFPKVRSHMTLEITLLTLER
jgi:hypothetical protein